MTRLLNGVISFQRTLRKDVRHAILIIYILIGAFNIDRYSLEFNAEWTELRLDVSLAERELRGVQIWHVWTAGTSTLSEIIASRRQFAISSDLCYSEKLCRTKKLAEHAGPNDVSFHLLVPWRDLPEKLQIPHVLTCANSDWDWACFCGWAKCSAKGWRLATTTTPLPTQRKREPL